MWSFGEAPAGFEKILGGRLAAARHRRQIFLESTDAFRYVNSEGDFLPGIILDKYAGALVLQLQTEGVDRKRDEIVRAIRSNFDEPGLLEKSTDRTEENLPDREAILYGTIPDSAVQIRTDSVKFRVDIREGHKSGFYLDQRKNLRLLSRFFSGRPAANLAEPRHLLDCFCYSGAFGVSLRNLFGRVTFVDSSEEALQLCEKNWNENGGAAGNAEFIRQDAFRYLRNADIGPFDAVVLDPPSFAKRKNEVDGACRGYKDILRLAMKLIRPGGTLAAFCCSHHISADLFQKVAFAAAVDAGRNAQILDRFGPDIDHPVSIDHPEGDYLKGLLLGII